MNSVMGYITKFMVTIGIMLLLLTFALGCGQDKNQEATFQKLLANPSEYDGKDITLEGFFFQGFEVQVIAEMLDYSGYAEGHLIPKGETIWIEGGIPKEVYDGLCQQYMMGPEERYGKVKVTGKFEYGGEYGHLGSHDSQIIPYEVTIIPWSPPTEATTQDEAVSAAQEVLSESLGVSSSEIELLRVEEVMWGNTSLGCPEPGKQYAEVIVPGFRVVFEYEGQQYEYHTNIDGSIVVTCQDNE